MKENLTDKSRFYNLIPFFRGVAMLLESVYSGDLESPIRVMQAFFLRLRDELSDDLDLTKINIHRLFYDVSQKGYSLQNFYFNGNSKFPFSQQIEDVLYEMTVCGRLTRPNPTMVRYNFVSLDETSYDDIGEESKRTVDMLVSTAKEMSS